MKTFKQFSTLSAEYPNLATQLATWIPREDIHKSFEWNIGGDVYVLESSEEYHQMKRQWGHFDLVEPYPNDMVMFALIINNTGGPTYFVPREYMV
jgi:hypothetical protein